MYPYDDNPGPYDPDPHTAPIPVVRPPDSAHPPLPPGMIESNGQGDWSADVLQQALWPDPEELLIRYRRRGVSQLPRWQNLYESFPDPPPPPWYRTFKSNLYTSVTVLSVVLFGCLALFVHLQLWLAALIMVAFWGIAMAWARAVSIRDSKYRARAWQRAAVEAFIKAAGRSAEFGKNMRISAHQVRRMAYTLKEGTLRICYVSRDHPIDLTRRIWLCAVLIVGILVAAIGFPRFIPGFLGPYLGPAIGVLALIGWYLSLKWWYWALLITDEYVRLVRVPPKWFPGMKVIDVPLPMRSIREVSAVYTHTGGWIGYGHVKIGTDMQNEEDSQTRIIRFMTQHDIITDIITREAHRDEDELLEEVKRLNYTVDERLPRRDRQQRQPEGDVRHGADWGRDSW